MMAGYEPNFSSPTVFKASMSNDTRCISSGLSILSSEDSLRDVFEDFKRKDEEVALNVLEAMNCIVR